MQNQVSKNWEVVKMANVANVTKLAGFEFTQHIKYSEGGEVIALRALNLTKGGLDLADVKRIKKSISDRLPRSKLFKGDILLSYTGTIGNFALITEDNRYHLAPNVSRIRTNERCLPEFVYHYFRTRAFKASLFGLTHGSSQSTVPMKNIREIPVPLPPLDEQRKIAFILSAFDEKIGVNNKIAKALEEMAQALFKEWFVHFRFPGYEKAEFVDSELGIVPEKWKVGFVKNLGKVVTGKTPFTEVRENFGSEIPFITIPDINSVFIIKTERYLSEKGSEKMQSILLPTGSICVSCIATVGLVGITTQQSLTNQQINSIIPNKEDLTYFLYIYFKNKKKELELFGSGGTATLIINKTKFENLDLIIPEENILKDFHSTVKPIYEKILGISRENQKLAVVRDLLMSKLMKGEIIV